MSDTSYVSPGAAALRLRVNPRTVVRWADSGRLGEVITAPSGHRRISVVAIERLAAELAERGAA